MDFTHVDNLARVNNGVKYLLNHQDLFDRTLDAKGMKNKRFPRNGSCIFNYDYKKNHPRKI